jgi:hypothetical protein
LQITEEAEAEAEEEEKKKRRGEKLQALASQQV